MHYSASSEPFFALSNPLPEILDLPSCYIIADRNYTSISVPSKILAIGEHVVVDSIAFGWSGIWAIAELKNECIKLYDSEDQLIRTFDIRKVTIFKPISFRIQLHFMTIISMASQHTMVKCMLLIILNTSQCF